MGSRTGPEQGKGHVVRERATEIGQGEVKVVDLFGKSGTFVSSYN